MSIAAIHTAPLSTSTSTSDPSSSSSPTLSPPLSASTSTSSSPSPSPSSSSFLPISSSCSTFSFGPIQLDPSQVFAVTSLSFAVVNLMPLLPGHVLVLPRRVVARAPALSEEEMSDLWVTAHRIARLVLEPIYHPDAYTFAIQDGAAAGQTIPHVHIHILPRHEGDFKRKDDIYDKLDEESRSARLAYEKQQQLIDGLKSTHACCGGHGPHDNNDTSCTSHNNNINHLKLDAPRVPRTKEEMAAEAQMYRQRLYSK